MDHFRVFRADVPRTSTSISDIDALSRDLYSSQIPQFVWIKEITGDLTKMPSQEFDNIRHRYRATADLHGANRWFSRTKKDVGYIYEPVPKALDESQAYTLDIAVVKDLNIKWDFATHDHLFFHLRQARQLEKLELQRCAFPKEEWENHFAHFKELNYLSFYSPRGGPPGDHLAGLKELPKLRTLRLVRCEFLTSECYQHLGEIPHLTHLDLTRTITLEKAPGESEMRLLYEDGQTRYIRQVTRLDPSIMWSLHTLMSKSLKTLDIAYCTAFQETEKRKLRSWGDYYGCALKE